MRKEQPMEDPLLEFQVSGDEDDWSEAVTVHAYDIGEAIDEYHRMLIEQRREGKLPSLTPTQRLYVREKGDEQVYEFTTSAKSWDELEAEFGEED